MDLADLSTEAQGRIRIVELQSAADLQRALEGKWIYLRDYKSAQYRLLVSANEDFFFKPIQVYVEGVFSAVSAEYFTAITGPDFVTILKDKLLPEVLKSATDAWCAAVENSLTATGFTFALIPGMSSWNRRGVLGMDFNSRLRAALQPALTEWEKQASSRCLELQKLSAPTEAAGGGQTKYRTFVWCGQMRYQCPDCAWDHYDIAEMDKHVQAHRLSHVTRSGQVNDMDRHTAAGSPEPAEAEDATVAGTKTVLPAEADSLWPSVPEDVTEPVQAGTRSAEGSAQVPPAAAPDYIGEAHSNRDFATETGRNSAVAAYKVVWICSEAALARTARVHPADLSKWKKGLLPPESAKRTRIENALRNNEAPTRIAKQSVDS